MRLYIFLLFLIVFNSKKIICQVDSLYNYYPPLDIPLVLSANFGELRPNHFHMGLDFKTNGKEGLKIFAIEDGYVSRIKVSAFGYGKVIYINHPNGITSVYAHCSLLLGKIDSIVKLTQEKNQNFEVEIFPLEDEIQLKKGENFALSGNTGSSTAPHLHFELRNTKTETALNPLKFGFDIVDSKPPEIKNIKLYGLTKEGYRIFGKSKILPVNKGKFGYYIGGDFTSIPSDFYYKDGGLGLAFETSDHYDLANNPLGIYKSLLIVNQDTIFGHKIDSVSFETTKHINSHSDYEEFTINKRKFQKSFRTQENPLTFYLNDSLGLIKINMKDTLQIHYITEDSKKNTSEIKFKLTRSDGLELKENNLNTNEYLYPNKSFEYKTELVSVTIPEGCIYEPILKKINTKNGFSIASSSTPIQKTVKISLPINSPKYPIEKYYIASNSNFLSTKYSNGWLYAEAKNLGQYSIKIDTIAPVIIPLNFLKTDTLIKKEILQWKIKDEKSNLSNYDLFIDSNWVLLQYESKGSYAFYMRPKTFIGKHHLKIVAKDNCKNEAIWEEEITFE